MTRKTLLGLLVGFVVATALGLLLLSSGIDRGAIHLSRPDSLSGPIVLGIAVVVACAFIFLAIGIGIFVYRDARQRGMEPVLWTVVAVLVPYFIGLVAYLIARQSQSRRCGSCGAGVPGDAVFCPRCGAPLSVRCPSCEQPVPEGAAFCPVCGAGLRGQTPSS